MSTPQASRTVAADREWARAMADGAPPFHRLGHPAFRPARAVHGSDEAATWRSRVSSRYAGADVALLGVLGLGVDDIERAFGEALLDTELEAPGWVEVLTRLIARLPLDQEIHAATSDSIDVGSECFTDAARELLGWDDLAARYPFLGDRALNAFSRHLATRVVMTCSAVLELENLGRPDLRWDFSRTAWRQRLIGFPALNYVMGSATRQWRQNSRELIVRLAADLADIRRALLGGRDPGVVADIAFDLGDRHNDGRSVAAVTFASGDSVVYKPKDLRCGATFRELIELVNSFHQPPMPTSRALTRPSHSWEEYVQQRSASSSAEVSALFHRYGAMLRILQLVEGRDFWVDNLRIQGDLPIFIDLECTFQPRISGRGFQVRPSELDPALYEESVLPTGAVTQPMEVPGFGRQDFGGLAGGGLRALPLGLWSGYRDRDNGNIMLRDGRLFWYPEVAWPVLGGTPVGAASFLGELEEGYRAGHAALVRTAPALLAADGPLGKLADLRVRALLRSTWEYLLLLRTSLDPPSLLSGNARELALAEVPASAPEWGTATTLPERMRVAWSEVESLRDLDVPEFLSSPGDSRVRDISGEPLADLFSGTAAGRIQRRLKELDDFDLDAHAHIMRVGVASIAALKET